VKLIVQQIDAGGDGRHALVARGAPPGELRGERTHRVLGALDHDHVVALRGRFSDASGRLHLVLEHVDRCLLDDMEAFVGSEGGGASWKALPPSITLPQPLTLSQFLGKPSTRNLPLPLAAIALFMSPTVTSTGIMRPSLRVLSIMSARGPPRARSSRSRSPADRCTKP
jgi:hypothetical protein